jgi:hypothetical protein
VQNRTTEDQPIIGSITTYVGDDWLAAKGSRVRICAVLRGRVRLDQDADSSNRGDSFVMDDTTITELGGVTKDHILDVAYVHPDGRKSLVHFNARAVDLERFAHLATPPAKGSRRPWEREPMLVKELMALLAECDPDARVFHCDQEFSYALMGIRGITTRQECRDDFSETSTDGDAPNDVFIVQEVQLGPGPANAWTAARRRLRR